MSIRTSQFHANVMSSTKTSHQEAIDTVSNLTSFEQYRESYILTLMRLLHYQSYNHTSNNNNNNNNNTTITMQISKYIYSNLIMNKLGVMHKLSSVFGFDEPMQIVEIKDDMIALVYSHSTTLFDVKQRKEIITISCSRFISVIPITRYICGIIFQERDYSDQYLMLYSIPAKVYLPVPLRMPPSARDIKLVDDNNLVFGSLDGKLVSLNVNFNNMRDSTVLYLNKNDDISPIYYLHHIKQSNRIVTLGKDKVISLWNWEDRTFIKSIKINYQLISIVYIPTTSKFLVSITHSKSGFLLLDEELRLVERHETPSYYEVLSYCEPLGVIVSKEQNRSMLLIDPNTFQIKHRINNEAIHPATESKFINGKSIMMSSGLFVNASKNDISFWKFCNNNL